MGWGFIHEGEKGNRSFDKLRTNVGEVRVACAFGGVGKKDLRPFGCAQGDIDLWVGGGGGLETCAYGLVNDPSTGVGRFANRPYG